MFNFFRVLTLAIIMVTLQGCTGRFARTAQLDITGTGHPENFYLAWLGPPDFKGTFEQYLSSIQEHSGPMFVHDTNPSIKITLNSYREYVSYELWQHAHLEAPVTSFDPHWLNGYERRDAEFFFYDCRPRFARNLNTSVNCYVFGFEKGICVAKFYFPWLISDLEPPPVADEKAPHQ